MGLTRPTARQINTVTTIISDPLTVINAGSTAANIDIGLIMNRDSGTSSNVAIFWNETTEEFTLAYTSSSGAANANVVVIAYSDLKANTLYGNIGGGSILSNVYVTGSLLPSIDVTYDLGSATQRWREGYFSGNTIYIGSESISVDSDGKWLLTSKGNRVEMDAADGFKFGNPNSIQSTITKAYVDGQITAANAGVTSANIGMKGYVDQGNTIQSAAITSANLGMKGYVDNSTLTANVGMKGYVDQGNTIQSAAITAVNAGITSANLGMKGYVDGQITNLINGSPSTLDTLSEIATALGNDANLSVTLTNLINGVQANVTAVNLSITSANVGMKGYVDQGNTIQSAAITAVNAAITSANVGMKGYVDTEIAGIAYSNVQVATYLPTHIGTIGASLINSTGNVIAAGGVYDTLAVNSNLTATSALISGNVTAGYFLGNGALLTGIVAGGGGGGATYTASETPPAGPAVNDVWYDTTSDTIFKYIDDGTNDFWVDIAGQPLNVNIGPVTGTSLNISGSGTVSGNLTVSGFMVGKSTQALYADLAENYLPDYDYQPGIVLIFGGDQEVTQSTESHDARVAGVVSTNPAYLMNSGAGGVSVALTGRVPCWVKGPVNKGDRLASSNLPGIAERLDSTQYVPGCIIGKSLETIESTDVCLIEIAIGRF